jgi:uncharacterized membrane protein YfcA
MAMMMVLGLSAAVVATSFISGILGMAGGMILMGILLATMSVGSAMIVHGVTQLASNGWRAILWRQFIDRRIVVGYLIGLALAVALFALVSLVLSRPWVLIALGATPFLTYLLPRQLELNVDRPGQPALCGFVCVAVQLLSGVSGPLLDTFFVPSKLDRKAVVATKAATQSFSHIAKIGYFGWVATAATEAVTPMLLAALVIAAVIGTSASRKVLEAMTDANFRNWTRRVVLVVGAVYLASGLWELAK